MPYKEYEKILKTICKFKPYERLKEMCIKYELDYDIAILLSKDIIEFTKLEDKIHVGGENFIEAYIKYEQQEMYCLQSFSENCYGIGILNRFGDQPDRFKIVLWSDLYAWCKRKYSALPTKEESEIVKDDMELRFEDIL